MSIKTDDQKSLQLQNHASSDRDSNPAGYMTKRTDNNEKDKNRCLICNRISLFLRLVSRLFAICVDSICVLLLLIATITTIYYCVFLYVYLFPNFN